MSSNVFITPWGPVPIPVWNGNTVILPDGRTVQIPSTQQPSQTTSQEDGQQNDEEQKPKEKEIPWQMFTSQGQSKTTSSWNRNAFLGLPPEWRKALFPLFQDTITGLRGVLPGLLTGTPNMTVLTNYMRAVEPTVERQRIQLRTAYNQAIRDNIRSLAQRGILDSSVAGAVLGQTSASMLGKNADLLARLNTMAWQRTLNFPFRATETLGGLLSRTIGGGRFSRSTGTGTSRSESWNYSPGLLGQLLGL